MSEKRYGKFVLQISTSGGGVFSAHATDPHNRRTSKVTFQLLLARARALYFNQGKRLAVALIDEAEEGMKRVHTE